MRLDQFVATCTALSRKDAKVAIARRRVSINGVPCKEARHQLDGSETVTLDQQPIALPGEVYLMLHKPAGVLSATRDSSQPTVTDLLPPDLAPRVHPAGRLDKDTTGLLLLTSDGQWSHRVTSPRADCPKRYRVWLAEPLAPSAIEMLEQGVQLKGEDAPTRPADVEIREPTVIDLTIREGRYHQVKRMIAAVGSHVSALHRFRIGELTLDPELAPGQYRALTESEIQAFR